MAAYDYHFITRWRVAASVADVYALLSNPRDYRRWWPEVFLNVSGPADRREIVDIHSKGLLPYTLRWQAQLIDARPPHGFTVPARGDFVGTGAWSFTADGPWANITYEWRVSARKPLLRYLSFLLRPIFAANHHWAMRRGEAGLRRELAVRASGPDLALAA
jgi:hypothetical protein